MKINFLLPSVGVGGGIRSTFELANRLQDRGHEVSIVYPIFPLRLYPLLKCDLYALRKAVSRIKQWIKNVNNQSPPAWFDLKAQVIRVPYLAEKWIPDADIIIATWWVHAYDIVKYSESKGKKFYFVRDYEIWDGLRKHVDKSYTLSLHRIASSIWLKKLIEETFQAPCLGPIPNGINTDLFYSEGNFECHTPKRIGLLYRRDKRKGSKDALEALIHVQEKYPDVQCVLFGERISLPDEHLVDKLKNMEYHPILNKDELRKIYNSLDIFVFPSHQEGFGNPPMEAMACGAACICTKTGAVPDYTIENQTALLVNPHSVSQLMEKIVYLLENEEKREEIAQNGYNHIQEFSWDRSTKRLEELFET